MSHPDTSGVGLKFGYCQKYNKKLPLDDTTVCVHPNEYCRFRPSCIIHELGKQNRLRQRRLEEKKAALGTLFGIGVGPGNPEMMTLQAINGIKKLEIIFASRKEGSKTSIAHEIAKPHIPATAQVKFLDFPVTFDREKFDDVWAGHARDILAVLKTGKDCGYLTIGDPSVYSTFTHLVRNLLRQESAARVEVFPGITSLTAAANLLNVPLVTDGETLTIIPSAQIEAGSMKELIRLSDNLVFMKIPSDAGTLIKNLEAEGLLHHAIWVQKCCLPSQRVVKEVNAQALEEEQGRYLSLMIVKKEGIAKDLKGETEEK